MKYRELGSTGLKVSRLGFGGTDFSGFFGKMDFKNIDSLHYAKEYGINYFDVAPWYTNSESIFGSALSQYPKETFHIATKVGRYQQLDFFDFRMNTIKDSIFRSLDNLKVDKIDIIQIHDPEFAPSIDILLNETLPTLEKLKEQGLIGNIGLTGYPLHFILSLFNNTSNIIKTILTYCRATLQDFSLSNYFDKFSNVGIINGSINAMSLLTPSGPAKWHPSDLKTQNICKNAIDFCNSNNVSLPRLSMHKASLCNKIDIHLLSTMNSSLLKNNINDFYNPLTLKEEIIFKKVLNILKPIQNYHWEDKEIMTYWRQKFKFLQKY